MAVTSDAAAGTFLKMTSEIEFTAGTSFSFCCLLKIITLSSPLTIFTKRNSSGGFPFVFRFVQYTTSASVLINSIGCSNSDGTTTRHWNTDTATGGAMINTALPDIAANVWHHVGFTCDVNNLTDPTTTSLRMFVDGNGYDVVRDPNGGTPTSLVDPNVVCSFLGPAAGLTTTHLNGSIAHAGFWNRKLTDAEFADLGGKTQGFYRNPRYIMGCANYWSFRETATPSSDAVGNNPAIWTGGITSSLEPGGMENYATGSAGAMGIYQPTMLRIPQQRFGGRR